MGASEVFSKIEQDIKSLNFIISSKDLNRPWGGFLVINETQAQEFLNKFFDGLNLNTLKI